jgi:DNA-binding NtrC family response regulator
VDDDAGVLRCVPAILADINYHVLTARSSAEALRQSREYKRDIHLLLSDFQMPGMSGIELGTQLTRERRQLKVLLMSGFPRRMLALKDGWHFLAKPFVVSQLRALVTGLVSSPDAAPGFSD